MSHWEFKQFAQDHVLLSWQSQGLNPDTLALEYNHSLVTVLVVLSL